MAQFSKCDYNRNHSQYSEDLGWFQYPGWRAGEAQKRRTGKWHHNDDRCDEAPRPFSHCICLSDDCGNSTPEMDANVHSDPA